MIARRLVEAGGLKGVEGSRVMPVYRASVNAGRSGDAVGSAEYGRGDGGGSLLTDMRGRSRQQRRRRPPIRVMDDRRGTETMVARARARSRDIAVRLLIRLS